MNDKSQYIKALVALLTTIIMVANLHAKDVDALQIKAEYFNAKVKDRNEGFANKLCYIDSLINIMDKTDKKQVTALVRKKADLLFDHGIYQNAVSNYKKILKDSANLSQSELFYNKYRLSSCYYYIGLYDKALSEAYRVFSVDKPDSLKYYNVRSYIIMGNVYLRLNKSTIARKYIQRAFEMFHDNDIPAACYNDIAFKLYLAKASALILNNNFKDAFKEIDAAKSYAKTDVDKLIIDMNLAIIYAMINENDLAEDYYQRILKNKTIHYNKAVAINNYAAYNLQKGNYGKAIEICNSNIPLLDSLNALHAKSNLYVIKSLAFKSLKDYKQAYECLDSANSINDSIFSTDIEQNILDITENFELFKDTQEKDLLKRMNINRQYLIVILSLLTIVAIIAIILLVRRFVALRKEHTALKAMVDSIQIERKKEMQSNIEEIETKNRELTSYALKMANINDSINEIVETGSKLSSDNQDIKHLVNQLKMLKLNEVTWDSFKIYFEQIHQSFFTILNSKHPDLTNGEIRMCAFIVMKIPTKDIAILTNRSVRTIETYKYRLSKKLNLSVEENLADYLESMVK